MYLWCQGSPKVGVIPTLDTVVSSSGENAQVVMVVLVYRRQSPVGYLNQHLELWHRRGLLETIHVSLNIFWLSWLMCCILLLTGWLTLTPPRGVTVWLQAEEGNLLSFCGSKCNLLLQLNTCANILNGTAVKENSIMTNCPLLCDKVHCTFPIETWWL